MTLGRPPPPASSLPNRREREEKDDDESERHFAGWVEGELAARREPDLRNPQQTTTPTLADVAARWQGSRVDVAAATTVQHRTALNRVLPTLGSRRVDEITPADVAALVAEMSEAGKARESRFGKA
jgi:hypothetical protein